MFVSACISGLRNETTVGHSYARENAHVTLRGLEASDNFVTRGSVMFIDNSTLSTYQVNEQRAEIGATVGTARNLNVGDV